MEIVLRCALPDRPGALAALAGTVSECGGDIQSIEVLEHQDGRALDDLVVAIDRARVAGLVDRLTRAEDVELIHTGPSRGDPGDAVTRLAIGLTALLDGSMDTDHAFPTLVGGLLRAGSASLCAPDDAPRPDRRTLLVPLAERVLVLRRDYPFTPTERQRATTIGRAVLAAAGCGYSSVASAAELSPG
ncbi:MAG: ACT domain-containing protein [Egibacteraceae bacterium]